MSDEILRALGKDLGERQRQVERGEAPPELIEPLGSEERMAVLDGAFERLAKEEPGESDESDESDESEVVLLSPASRSRRSFVPIIGVVLATAAIALLWWGQSSSPSAPGGTDLPLYSVTRLAVGDAVVRAAGDVVPEHVVLPPDGRFEVVLTPVSPVNEAVGVLIVARPAEGEPRLVRPSEGVEISGNGAVRLRGPLDRLVTLEPGDWTLELLVGSPSTLPTDVAAVRDAPEPSPWRTLVVHATIE